MTPNRLFILSGWMYTVMGVSLLFSSPWVAKSAERPLDGVLIGTTVFLAAICFYLGYSAFRARLGTNSQKRRFAFFAGYFCGGMAGLGGWTLGVILAIPLMVGVLGMRDILWKANED